MQVAFSVHAINDMSQRDAPLLRLRSLGTARKNISGLPFFTFYLWKDRFSSAFSLVTAYLQVGIWYVLADVDESSQLSHVLGAVPCSGALKFQLKLSLVMWLLVDQFRPALSLTWFDQLKLYHL